MKPRVHESRQPYAETAKYHPDKKLVIHLFSAELLYNKALLIICQRAFYIHSLRFKNISEFYYKASFL